MPEASRRRRITRRLAAALAAAAALVPPSQAQPVAELYRGKTLRMIIGYGPGGGYDIYGRLVAEFLPRHLPGSPMILAQNMPGAGSFVAAKYLNEIAPRDGTVLGSLAQTRALDNMTSVNSTLDVARMPYIGRVVTNIDVGAALPRTGIGSFNDVRAKEYNVGASGGGSTTVLFPTALKTYAGAKLKLIRGYSGTKDIVLCRRSRSSRNRRTAATCCMRWPAPARSAAPFSPPRTFHRSGLWSCARHLRRCSRMRTSSPPARGET
jgi:tripartite-type tricarboxylate transporter receptor subunit TctC